MSNVALGDDWLLDHNGGGDSALVLRTSVVNAWRQWVPTAVGGNDGSGEAESSQRYLINSVRWLGGFELGVWGTGPGDEALLGRAATGTGRQYAVHQVGPR